ncbi:hypothetical protein PAXINDRAFT_15206 [Paxillus involutus ATCC 200175]|uniref:Uncharacterized protein n=1 Tax=Paxillus involutus ATCC 200175 TaxID=664439 RepID=A0A0C9T8P3_PAXIN|nr:hypothetical protein PAXINDRAFT_15206 [Paxillus involutus ATCC 200175]
MAQGVSHVLDEMCPSSHTYDDNSTNANDIYSWKQDDTKALGYLILRVQESICVKHDALISAKAFWNALSTEYGTQGISATYGKFKVMLDTPIPSKQHPTSAFNKINAHFTCLKKADFEIPIKVQAMILLSKLPSSMNSIAQIVAMDKELMTPTRIEKAAVGNQSSLCVQHRAVGNSHPLRPQASFTRRSDVLTTTLKATTSPLSFPAATLTVQPIQRNPSVHTPPLPYDHPDPSLSIPIRW